MNKNKIPTHLVLIPDGNRRWALERGLDITEGYKRVNYEYLENILLEAKKLGVKYVSLWIFSTDNWKRSKVEVNFLFNYFLSNAPALLEGAHKFRIRIRHMGRKDRLPKKVVEFLDKLEEETKDFKDFNVQLCLDYGGKDEIIRAVNKIIKSKTQKIDEKSFLLFLDSKDIPEVDLIIRTSGEQRTSGFMPYLSGYAELYFANVNFPDFTALELRKAIFEFEKRQRRFGGS
jgi:undecaprenyl diphosphate synthase